MPDTLTANYSFVKPEINGSPNTWGNKLNQDMDLIDSTIYNVALKAYGAVPKSGYASAGDLITAPLRYAAGVNPLHGSDLIQADLVKAWFMRTTPKGEIIIWGGTHASIPLGFVLCDGGTYNGFITPDLRHRFILGSGHLNPGGVGGSWEHNHGGWAGETAINWDQMPHHGHAVADPGHSHYVNDPAHTHSHQDRSLAGSGDYGYGGIPGTFPSDGMETRGTSASPTGIWLSGSGTGIGIYGAGGGQAHNHTIASSSNAPPYYILAFVMRCYYPWEF